MRSSTSEVSERLKVARDLHDTVAQEIAALGYACDEAIALSPMGQTRQSLLAIRLRLTLLGTTLRDEISLLRDQSKELGKLIADFVQELNAKGDIEIHNAIPVELTYGSAHDLELFRVAREVITNLLSHSKARSVELFIRNKESRSALVILDDGIAFERKELSGSSHHFGMATINERLQEIGCTIEFTRENWMNSCEITLPS